MKKTKSQMVEVVLGWFEEAPESDKVQFKKCTEDKLIQYHSSIGRQIRNEFGLWEEKWAPIIEDGVDCSPEHPDAISMEILKEVWRKVNATN